ncbi:MAG: hypothetical protein Kow00124_12180 [Anaerolineae bacterium]
MLKRAGHAPIVASSGSEGIEMARRELPDVIIVDIMMPDLTGYEVCRALRADPDTRDIPLLILTALSQPEQRDQAEDAGADEYVTKPVTRDDLLTAVDSLLETGARNRPEPVDWPARPAAPAAPPHEPPPQPTPQPAPPPAAQPAPPAAQPAPATTAPSAAAAQGTTALPVVAVMGLAGGAGATTIAVNLALGLMQHGRSCIIDFHNVGGQVASHLKLAPPRASWVDLVGLEPGSPKRRIGLALTAGHRSGVALLAAPLSPSGEYLGGDSLQYLFEVLGEGFKRIVVDLPATLNAMGIATLRRARHIVLVASDDAASLLIMPGALAMLDELELPGQTHIIVNRAHAQGVSREEIAAALGRPLVAEFPHEPAQVDALASGVPLVMSQPRSPFSRTILHFARQL